MHQRDFGAVFASLVIINRLEWTVGTRHLFANSNLSQRGVYGNCGTPLSVENFDDDRLRLLLAHSTISKLPH
jgi:hypothetical protein